MPARQPACDAARAPVSAPVPTAPLECPGRASSGLAPPPLPTAHATAHATTPSSAAHVQNAYDGAKERASDLADSAKGGADKLAGDAREAQGRAQVRLLLGVTADQLGSSGAAEGD